MLRTLLAALAAVALVPGVADGATISFAPPPNCPGEDKYMECPGPTIAYVAGPGEANVVRVDGGTFHDDGADVVAPQGCTQVEPRTVRCPTTNDGRTRVSVDLGDGDDRFESVPYVLLGEVRGGDGRDVLRGSAVLLDGGAGDDEVRAAGTSGRLAGGPGDDLVVGTEGQDALRGGPGADTLQGGGGDDTLSGEGDRDTLDGGPGFDRASYAERTEPVTVTLPAAGAEDAPLVGIEGAEGGQGPHTLTGDAAPNVLDGNGGDDTIDGGGGNDTLSGDAGVDRLRGGDGDDAIEADRTQPQLQPDSASDEVACGDGRDLVGTRDDLIATDCERVTDRRAFGEPGFAAVPRARGRRTVALRVPCPRDYRRRGRCRATLEVRVPGTRRVLVRRVLTIGARGATVRLRARKALPRGPLGLRVMLRGTGLGSVDVRWRSG